MTDKHKILERSDEVINWIESNLCDPYIRLPIELSYNQKKYIRGFVDVTGCYMMGLREQMSKIEGTAICCALVLHELSKPSTNNTDMIAFLKVENEAARNDMITVCRSMTQKSVVGDERKQDVYIDEENGLVINRTTGKAAIFTVRS